MLQLPGMNTRPHRTDTLVLDRSAYETDPSTEWQFATPYREEAPAWAQPAPFEPTRVRAERAEFEVEEREPRDFMAVGVRIFGVMAMLLAVAIVVLDSAYNENRGSVLASAVVGAIFTVGGILALPKR